MLQRIQKPALKHSNTEIMQAPQCSQTIRAALRAIRLLAPLSDVELDALGARVGWSTVQPGQPLISHLAASDSLYFVVSGRFRVELSSSIGRSLSVRHVHAGAHVGELAALTAAPRSVTVIAEEESLVGECAGAALRELVTSNGAFALTLARELAFTIISLTDRLFELAALETRFRLYAELLRLAESAEIVDEGRRVAPAPTHEQIAAAIGAQRESVTRELRYLAGQGVLTQHKRELIIHSLERLRDMVRARAGDVVSHNPGWRG